ncbi:MAG: hypothetical protein K2X93_21490 [Candidatus Obscuribacterales bacterium]|nr:hypothetical protein [Candidatus Obscuribacterales bacterium]
MHNSSGTTIAADQRYINAYLNRAKLFAKLDQLEEAHLNIEQARKEVAYNSTMGKMGDILRIPQKGVFRDIIASYSES